MTPISQIHAHHDIARLHLVYGLIDHDAGIYGGRCIDRIEDHLRKVMPVQVILGRDDGNDVDWLRKVKSLLLLIACHIIPHMFKNNS